MISTIYIEAAVTEHPRAQLITAKFPKARIIECDSYQEFFNRRHQNFRIQKEQKNLAL